MWSEKFRKIEFDDSKHYPNKGEAATLRKLMSLNGLTEKEVRAIKKYRIMLSAASKMGQKEKHNAITKWFRSKVKEACKVTGFVPQHPETIVVLDEILSEAYSSVFNYPWYVMHKPCAKTVINLYAK